MWRRFTRSALAGAVALMALALPVTAAASPGDRGSETAGDVLIAERAGTSRVAPSYTFQVHLGGRCLDADTNEIGENGARVQLWSCNGAPQQRWIMMADGAMRSLLDPSFCLDADLNTVARNGTVLQLWQCNGRSQQRFRHVSEVLQSQMNGKCIDADPATAHQDGGRVYLWTCNGTDQQWWHKTFNG